MTHTLVYWIVKRIGVNTPTKGKLALVICSILICGLLGTLGRRKRGYRPYYAADPGFAGRHAYRGGHTV